MKENGKKNTLDKVILIIAVLFLTGYSFHLISLHYNQTLYRETGLFESDLFLQIEMALDGWGYSITALIFRVLSLLPGKAFNFAVALFLAACEIGTVALTYVWMRKNDVETKVAVLMTALAGFVMPFHISAVQPYRYIGYQSPSIWHNSTYIVMKVCAFATIWLYVTMSKKYKDELKTSQLIAFAILLALTTTVKSNFIVAFAPAALIFLIIDKILGVRFKTILLCAATVIPSIAIILFQNLVLFGEDTGNSIIIDPLYTVYLRAERPYFTMIMSAAFPVFVFLVNVVCVFSDTYKDFKTKKGTLTHRWFLFSWTMWFVSFVQLLLLRETGKRELDENFAWGYDFCLFIVLIVSIVYYLKNLSKDGIKNKTLKITYAVAGGAILAYQAFCGVVFFVKLCNGVTYFMQ